MLRIRLLAATCAALVWAVGPASAQDQPLTTAPPPAPALPAEARPPEPVSVKPLAAPDLFSSGGRDTGLPADLWRGASASVMGQVLPLLSSKTLSPASRALARRVLATGASAPGAIGKDPTLAGQRIAALIALGGLKEANAILATTSGLDRSGPLAQAAAEAALLAGDSDRACAVGGGLSTGRDEIYWLRLRAYCELKRGDAGAAQLTFDLAQGQARDPVYGRLMGARLAGAGDPGKASLRNGLDYALSHDLGLDLAQAAPSPAVAAALNPETPTEAVWPGPAAPGAVGAAFQALASGDLATAQTLRASLAQADVDAAGAYQIAVLDAALAASSSHGLAPALDRLIERGGTGDSKTRAKAQAAALVVAALGAPMSDDAEGQFAGFPIVEAKAPSARGLALNLAAADKRVGETALLALWISAEAGAAGPAPGDRARIVLALRTVGLDADARAYVVEGLLALR